MTLSRPNIASIVIIILHLVGIAGTLITQTSALTVSLTPINLLISATLLFIFSNETKRTSLFLFLSFVIGMLVEIVGVKTGFPFGEYWYEDVLGFKVMEVPLIIGINWFMVGYLAGTLSLLISNNVIIRIALGASIMTALDFMIEPVAIALDYWEWASDTVPLSNYVTWWIVGALIQWIFIRILVNERNKVSIPLIISQLVYFTAIIIFY